LYEENMKEDMKNTSRKRDHHLQTEKSVATATDMGLKKEQ
jgi:hypothetical protein